jgi:hypothetical protein
VENKVAIITGSGSDIGSIAASFMQKKARKSSCNIQKKMRMIIMAEIRKDGSKATSIKTDSSSPNTLLKRSVLLQRF